MNKWFKEFVESFGECTARKITEKQFNCFARNIGDPVQVPVAKNATRYEMETSEIRIRAEIFHKPYAQCYVTIRKKNPTLSDAYEALREMFTERIDALVEAGADDDTIEKMEEIEDLYYRLKEEAEGRW